MTCETVAVIGATLANGGVAPITGEKVLKPDAGRWHFLHFVNSIFLSFSLNHIQSSARSPRRSLSSALLWIL